MQIEVAEAFEIARAGAADQVLISAEHASNRLPAGWRWPAADQRLITSHWAWDPGVRELSLELAELLSTTAVLARFTRLLADPNRPEGHPELFRQQADGAAVELNQDISDAGALQRLSTYHRPYHQALSDAVRDSRAALCFSIHSYTPVYQGQVRELEVGVLYNREEALATSLMHHLQRHGHDTQLNEPYSGKAGLIYSVERAAERHGRRALEIEVRNDLLLDSSRRGQLAEQLAAWLSGAQLAL